MKRERAQLSVKNPCHIPKHRYYELKHFCLQYPDWYQYDMDHGYNSSGLLMRLAQTSSQFTDNENAYEIEKAINKIVANDPANIYKKFKIKIKDDTGYAQSA